MKTCSTTPRVVHFHSAVAARSSFQFRDLTTGYKTRFNVVDHRRSLVCNSEFRSDLLGPNLDSTTTTTTTTTTSDQSEVSLEDAINSVKLESEASMDYSKLRDLLREQDFRKADDETRAALIRLAGEDAISRGWVYFTEVTEIPTADLATIDALWRASSNEKFGYSIQKKIFERTMKRWTKFFKEIDWTVGEENNYRKWPTEFIYSLEAKEGHLPLTNCLRGTQLFEAIMNHEAFSKVAQGDQIPDISNSNKWTGF
eukprot:g4434.t1